MAAIQLLFLAALTIVTLLILGFAAVVFVGAARSGSGSVFSGAMFQRLRRPPVERAEVDRWAFYAHRITGFAIFAFLCLHVLDISLYAASQRWYTQVHHLYGTAPLRLFECGLLVAILFHTFNGLRVLAIDLGNLSSSTSRRILVATLVLTMGLGLSGSAVILKPVIS